MTKQHSASIHDDVLVITEDAHELCRLKTGSIRRIVAYKKDLFRPHLINMAVTGDDGETEIEEVSQAFAIMLCKSLGDLGLAMTPFETWWSQVTDPLHRQGDITVL
jgi:hypothetical protein